MLREDSRNFAFPCGAHRLHHLHLVPNAACSPIVLFTDMSTTIQKNQRPLGLFNAPDATKGQTAARHDVVDRPVNNGLADLQGQKKLRPSLMQKPLAGDANSLEWFRANHSKVITTAKLLAEDASNQKERDAKSK
jgi:hypothetical protein